MSIAVLLLLTFAESARADCELLPAESASATMTTVTVNGKLHMVRGAVARGRFAAQLADCDLDVAQVEFDRWRSARRIGNTCFIVGAFVLWPLWIVGGVEYGIAGGHKNALVGALSQ